MKLHHHLLLLAALSSLAACGSLDMSYADDENEGGIGVASTADAPAEMAVGDRIVFSLANGAVTMDFEEVDPSARFILIAGTSDTALTSAIEIRAEGLEALAAAQIVSTEEEARFDVLASTAAPEEGTVPIDAELRCTGSHIALYVDKRVGSETFSDGEVDEACETLDDIVGRIISILGPTSDVDGDGTIAILITPQINEMSSQTGGPLGGYFYSADLYERSDIAPFSNHREVIFVHAPDPEGAYGVRISTSAYLDQRLPTVVAHELQHAINYYHRVFTNGGAAEEVWLDEGMSHLIEHLMGFDEWNTYRYASFLAKPARASVVTSGPPTTGERGAAYLFLRFLYDHAADGDAFLRSLTDSARTGVANIEAAFAGSDPDFDQFSEFIGRWTLELAMSGDVSLDALAPSQTVLVAPTAAAYFAIDDVPKNLTSASDVPRSFIILIRTN